MRITRWTAGAGCTAAAVALTMALTALAVDEPKPGDAPQLPPGWTAQDMQACIAAATPGEQHKRLAEGAGNWTGKTTMWMYPGAEPVTYESATTVKPILDGRYVEIEMTGQMPGMGPYTGRGTVGYDNVARQYVATWIDNHATGIMRGVGESTDGGKTITWTYTFSCPITGKPATMREIDKTTGPNTATIEMHMTDPKSGKEFKMMAIELQRKAD